MTCSKCQQPTPVLVGNRCPSCDPFRACRHCPDGTLHSKPEPNWMNRWVCDKCGKAVSRRRPLTRRRE